jgi:small acid-soluble spore protein D (minor alpha/beta-type SASP)
LYPIPKNITTYKTYKKINNTYTEINFLCTENKELNIMANSRNKLLVPGIEQYLDQVKYEIAQEFGVNLGSDTVSRANGSVGGEITKRLVQQAQAQLSGQSTQK